MGMISSTSHKVLFGVLIAFLLGSGTAFSQSDIGQRPGISELWTSQVVAFEQGTLNPECDDRKMDIQEHLQDSGILESPEIAAAFVVLGLQAVQNGKRRDAQWAFDAALSIDPLNVPASRAAIKNGWHLGIGEGFSALTARFGIAFSRMKDARIGHLLVGNAALAIEYALLAFAAACIVVIFFRHCLLFANEILRFVPFISNYGVIAVILVFVLGGIAVSPAGIVGLLITCLLVAFAFSENNYRVVLWLIWGLVFCIFPLSYIHVFSITVEENNIFRISRYVARGGYSEPAISELTALADAKDDPKIQARVQYMLGLLYKRGGFFDDAKRAFEKYQTIFPQDPSVYINLGNIEFVNDRIKSASEYYRKAESLDSQNPIIFFNLSKAYLSQFRFDEARDMQQRALKIDPVLTGRLNATHTSKVVRMVYDINIPSKWLWDEYAGSWKIAVKTAGDYWQPPVISTPLIPAFIGWTIVAVLLGLIQLMFRKLSLSRFCLKCGKPMRPDAKSGGTDHICVACHMIYFKKHEVSRKKQVTGEATDRKGFNWHALLIKILSVIIPGSGKVYNGRFISGMFFLSVWALCIGILTASPRFLVSYYQAPYVEFNISRFFIITVLVINYLFSAFLALREEDE
jgi:TM2 domain-containing membrane protein YozV